MGINNLNYTINNNNNNNNIFSNDKKTFLSKLDKSKKGSIDKKIILLIDLINQKPNYYTTSSCSGRVYLWKGSGKKNETQWIKMSHELIKEKFFQVKSDEFDTEFEIVWLRLEDFILHVCCDSLNRANQLLNLAKKIYKKSCILSASRKVIVEIRGSEFMEMPIYINKKCLISEEIKWLTLLINERLKRIWNREKDFLNIISQGI